MADQDAEFESVDQVEAAHQEEVAAQLQESAAQRPDQEDGESLEDYITRLRELQVAETRTDR